MLWCCLNGIWPESLKNPYFYSIFYYIHTELNHCLKVFILSFHLVFRVSQWGSQGKNDPTLYIQHRLLDVMKLAQGWQSLSYWSWSWNVGLLAAKLIFLLTILTASGFCLQGTWTCGLLVLPSSVFIPSLLPMAPWPPVTVMTMDVIGGSSFHKFFLSAAVPAALGVAEAASSN